MVPQTDYILDINSTGAMRIPIGNDSTDKSGITTTSGLIRYIQQIMNLGYSTAGSLGGVKTPTGNAKSRRTTKWIGILYRNISANKAVILANGNGYRIHFAQ